MKRTITHVHVLDQQDLLMLHKHDCDRVNTHYGPKTKRIKLHFKKWIYH